jgi:hypothetical protein
VGIYQYPVNSGLQGSGLSNDPYSEDRELPMREIDSDDVVHYKAVEIME